MRRLLAAVAVTAFVASIALGVHASASQLLVTSRSMTQTLIAPVAAPILLELRNGSTVAGRAEQDDRIVLTFGRPLDASSLCSTWPAAPATTQSINGNGAVSVTLADGGAGADSLSVATPGACGGTFGLGTISLGSAAFVTGSSVAFTGNGSGKTTLTYDPATAQLTIVFGGRTGTGTVGTVGSTTATFTPASTLRYVDGATVLPSTAAVTGVLL